MPWVRIDDRWDEHDKTLAVGPLGMALQITALCFANRKLSDGFIPRSKARTLVDVSDFGNVQDVIDSLVEHGVWDVVKGGYQIHDYLEFQPSKEQVLAAREQRSAAGRKSAVERAAKRDAERAVEQDVERDTQPVSQHPSPVSPLSVVPNTNDGGEAEKERAKTLANVTIALGREGFDPHDLTEPLNALDAELIASPGRITSPVAWTRGRAEAERSKREAAEKSRAVDNCSICDDNGLVFHEGDDMDTAIRCDHEVAVIKPKAVAAIGKTGGQA